MQYPYVSIYRFALAVVAAMIWYEEQTATATAIGLIIMVMGCMIYAIGIAVSDIKTKVKAKRLFWSINVWVIDFIPLSIFYNMISETKELAPYPILTDFVMIFVWFWAIYIVIGLTVDMIIHKLTRK